MTEDEIDALIERVAGAELKYRVRHNPYSFRTWLSVSKEDRDSLLEIASRYRDLLH